MIIAFSSLLPFPLFLTNRCVVRFCLMTYFCACCVQTRGQCCLSWWPSFSMPYLRLHFANIVVSNFFSTPLPKTNKNFQHPFTITKLCMQHRFSNFTTKPFRSPSIACCRLNVAMLNPGCVRHSPSLAQANATYQCSSLHPSPLFYVIIL